VTNKNPLDKIKDLASSLIQQKRMSAGSKLSSGILESTIHRERFQYLTTIEEIMTKYSGKLSILAAVAYGLVGCLTHSCPAIAAPASNPQTDNVLECLFRYMSKNHDRPVHGISLDGLSPTASFMQRFTDNPAIEPVSAIDGSPAGFSDKKTHKPADIYTANISSIKWIDQKTVTIEASAHASGLDGYVGTYTIAQKDNGWTVTSYKDSGMVF